MGEASVRLGDHVCIVSAPATEACGFAGRVGVVYGWAVPPVSGVEVIGGTDANCVYNVWLEELLADYWFVSTLVEVVTVSPQPDLAIANPPLPPDDQPEPRRRRFGWHKG